MCDLLGTTGDLAGSSCFCGSIRDVLWIFTRSGRYLGRSLRICSLWKHSEDSGAPPQKLASEGVPRCPRPLINPCYFLIFISSVITSMGVRYILIPAVIDQCSIFFIQGQYRDGIRPPARTRAPSLPDLL